MFKIEYSLNDFYAVEAFKKVNMLTIYAIRMRARPGEELLNGYFDIRRSEDKKLVIARFNNIGELKYILGYADNFQQCLEMLDALITLSRNEYLGV